MSTTRRRSRCSTGVSLVATAIISSAGAFQLQSDGFLHQSKSAATYFRGTRSTAGLRIASVSPPSSPDIPTKTDELTIVGDLPKLYSSESFDWFKAWYPIVPVEYLDVEKPHAFKLLGMDMVIWNDGPVDSNPTFQPRKDRAKDAKKSEGQWRVFIDECPHRKVPLSEGRIEDDGSLLCSYHGWRFNGRGETIDIPQIPPSELERIKANPKSNCNSFPVQVKDGILWVWPDASDDARIESALAPVPTNNYEGEDIDEDRLWLGPWNFRELPYGHDYFIENVVDPAHVPVSHHNVVGSRYSNQSLHLETLQPLTKAGFSIGVKTALATSDMSSTTTFHAPSQVLIKQPFGKESARQYLELYSSPSRPGFSNHVGRMVVVKDTSKTMPNALRQFTFPMPIWVNHVLTSLFLNQDALFLHGQERTFTHTGKYRTAVPANDSYSKNVLPTSADKGVMLFRGWMSKYAHGFIPFQGDTTMTASNKEVVFDVWNAHTKNCKYCLAALKRIKTVRTLTFFASALVATIRPKVLGTAGSTLAALGLSGLGLVLSKLIGMFYRFEFSHAENH
eukprot:CAMPEP_0172427894 /NCGR_PEP_ID=MMETSP1064-20121228/44030_1 /TAXON_ID=202472 /ORGANISM="Aulacoseira subarctica , Strain CCAP 1002/5" /LENGTH=562 /DNA_ID=CAMNT_0013172377 /DNA_START=113 /DNA_END=1801 /DNA_ORIENTATION=+